MSPRRKKRIVYCSYFVSHVIHSALAKLATEYDWIIDIHSWGESGLEIFSSGLSMDGVISHMSPEGLVGPLKQGDLPLVTMNTQTARELGVPGAVMDHHRAGRMVAHHFLELGFSSAVFVIDRPRYGTFDERLAGFNDAYAEAGLRAASVVRAHKYKAKTYRDLIEEIGAALVNLPKPLGVVAANDRIAVHVLVACHQFDLPVPAHVAVCSFDNDPLSSALAPIPLSSVDTDTNRQVHAAAAILDDLMKGKQPPRSARVIPPRELVVRRSSGVRAEKGAVMAKAMSYIHEHAYAPDLTINEIAEEIEVSRSGLFAMFQRELARTPLQCINELRIKKAKRLLSTTTQSLKDIAPQCGFASYGQMFHAFKKTEGKAPGHFQRQGCRPNIDQGSRHERIRRNPNWAHEI